MKNRKYWSCIPVNFYFQCLPTLNLLTFHNCLVPILLIIFTYAPTCVHPWNDFSEQSLSSCNRTRKVITNTTWGVISERNYTQDSYCEFVIIADEPNRFITLEIHQVRTECSYDYLFVFDGESYSRNTTLLASFSGASENSVTLMARSGRMLILLYSDTNYALEGFQAEFSITRCPLNCSETRGGGVCIPLSEDGANESSENQERGGQSDNHDISKSTSFTCRCSQSYTGEGCEIKNKEVKFHGKYGLNGERERNHMIPKSVEDVDFDTLLIPTTFPNLYHRVGHSATKIEDKVYIFGGFDLNKILGDLKIYDLITGQIQDFNWFHNVDSSKFFNLSSATATKFDLNFKCAADPNSDVACKPESQSVPSNDDEDGSANELKSSLDKIGFWPQARFGHASTAFKSGFFIHGGRLSNGNGITNELLYFNTTTMQWIKIAGGNKESDKSVRLPHLMYHTMTSTPSGQIYAYGGGSQSGSFSSKLYRFHGDHAVDTLWDEIHSTCCGKPKDRSVLGHTTSYWDEYRALLIFGGVTMDIGRFSKISSQFWIYLLDDNVWVEIEYRRNQNIMHYKSTTISSISNTERAFHSMDIIGSYMLIIGGYTHSHNKDETCYSNQMLVYNLECHQFVPDLPIRISGIDQGHGHKIQEGVFGHKTAVFKEKVFIIGGYRGYLDGRIRSIGIGKWLPFNGHKIKGDCSYYDKWRCSGDRNCGWCPTSEICYEKQAGSKNCTTNLQTSQCPGICPLLSSCQACVVTFQCSWCDFMDACFDTHDLHYTRQTFCNSQPLSTDFKSCVKTFDRQGATLFEYRHPADFLFPDQVKLVNSTVFRLPREVATLGGAGSTIMVMKGFLVGHIQNPRRIELCGSQARVNITIENESYYNRHQGNSGMLESSSASPSSENLTTHLNWSVHLNCMNLSWPSGFPVVIQPDSRLRFDISANTSRASFDAPVRVILQQRMSVKNSSSIPSTPYRISKESLLPFSSGNNTTCLGYQSCLSCVGDASCTWKDGKCHSRLSTSEIDEALLRSSQLVLTVDQCPVCSDLTTCVDCLSFSRLAIHSTEVLSSAEEDNPNLLHSNLPTSSCEWSEEESSCHRRGRVDTAVKELSSCPGHCHLRKNCSSCLEGPGKCVWCADRNECFVFDVYTSFYQYGQCVHWMDKKEQCQRCAKQSSCEDCIRYLGCGWKYNENGGSCTEGDFTGPLYPDDMVAIVQDLNTNNKSVTDTVMNVNPNSGSGYAYATCPDVDECSLGSDDCHENALCVNTPGSFRCVCKQGFTGDGKIACEETCYEPCVHGTCLNAEDLVSRRTKNLDDQETPSPPGVHFMCDCDLGFTGVTCSIDCGCYNHSSCETGKCDQCQDWTMGEHCELCVPGSFGTATTVGGCTPCQCNGHGDLDRGVCHLESGECFCLNNTAGPDCSSCLPGYFGDPRNGKPCFSDCTGRALMEDEHGYFGINSRILKQSHLKRTRVFSFDDIPLVEHCMWILKLNDSDHSNTVGLKSGRQLAKPRQIKISVAPNYNIPCSENSLNIYTGIPSFTHPHRKHSVLIASVCSPGDIEGSLNSANMMTGKPLEIFVEASVATIVLRSIVTNTSSIKFNATFEFLKEVDKDSIKPTSASPSTPSSSVLSFTVGNSRIPATRLYDGHSVYSRFGHSLHADEKNVWIFGGYSLSHGTLNDVRQFNRQNGKWEALTIDVNFVENEDSVPPPRYFHGGALGPNNDNIVIHGGLTERSNFLSDTWRFDTRVKRWSKIYGGRGDGGNSSLASHLKLAGHTLTLRRRRFGVGPHQSTHEYPELVLIGGFNTEMGFSNRTFSLNLKPGNGGSLEWEEIATFDANPIGVYGHSTVYHEGTDSFYVFGGVVYENGKVSVSQTLFSLNWSTKKWSVLPPILENQVTQLPVPKYFHSAVTTDSYMVILGGTGGSHANLRASVTQVGGQPVSSKTDKTLLSTTTNNYFALAYAYKCNLWTLLEGENSLMHRTAGSASIWKDDVLFMGGWDWQVARTTESLFTLRLPSDICSVQNSSENCKATVGCSYCFSNNNQSAQCYSADLEMPRECSLRPNGTELKIDFLGGTLCTRKWMESRNCNQFVSCTDCLAAWPSHEDARVSCQWCTNCQVAKCIQVGKSCHEENSCSQKQRETLEIRLCPERQCSASDCDKCTASGKCVWTRQILRSTEYSWKLHSKPVYDWNCVRKQILNTSTTSYKVIASPPEICPVPCISHRTCEKCLSSMNDIDKRWFLECRWSISKNLCFSPAHSHLLCFGGTCGPTLSGDIELCPKPCSEFKSCSSCLQNPSCGWCADTEKNGVGHCLAGDSMSSQVTNCTSVSADTSSAFASSVSWNYLTCPPENECHNSHHTCDEVSEKCIDLDHGYRCECREGYKDDGGSCVPVCDEGCLNGTCVMPQTCECFFGYVGNNCSVQCDCNGHSDCAGIDDLKNCTECKNDTMGPQCSKCKPLFVGDPRNGRPCISCLDYCNGHSHICLPQDAYFQYCGAENYDVNELLMKIRSNHSILIQEGSSGEAWCCGCDDKTSGSKCEECLPGFSRGTDDKRRACRRCECHGHAEPQTINGDCDCNCQNNTESDHCTVSKSPIQCWKSQCAKCKEAYLGNPTNGHQCYRHMFVDSTLPINGLFENNSINCLDQKPQELCSSKPKPLLSGRTVYFAIQPKFINVDIRFNLDVTVGAVHVYLSPKDDTFVIRPDNNTWMHRVEFDVKYGLNGERDPSSNTIPENIKDVDPTMTSLNAMGSANEEEGLSLSKGIGSGAFRVVEIEAASFVTHRILEDPRAFLVVRNVRNRLVITLPQDYHDLRLTRFYIVLEGVGDKSYGSVSFRQDQLHIDLFVFFSVFFSAFFLFLAACGIAWKIKQNMETRRARHRHVAEMLSMAKRPFAVWTVILEPDQSSPLYLAYTQCRKTCRKGCICIRPMAIESTQYESTGVCTMLVSLPGSLKNHATTHIKNFVCNTCGSAFPSSVMLERHERTHLIKKFDRKAVEIEAQNAKIGDFAEKEKKRLADFVKKFGPNYTIQVEGYIFVAEGRAPATIKRVVYDPKQYPGGTMAPVRLCLASCLAYTRSNQPIHARRRRR